MAESVFPTHMKPVEWCLVSYKTPGEPLTNLTAVGCFPLRPCERRFERTPLPEVAQVGSLMETPLAAATALRARPRSHGSLTQEAESGRRVPWIQTTGADMTLARGYAVERLLDLVGICFFRLMQ